MALFGIDYTQSFSIGNAIQVSPKSQETPTPLAPVAPAKVESSLPSSDNMLSSLFVHEPQEQSRYIKGIMTGFDVQNSLMNNMQSVVAGYAQVRELSSMVGDEMTYAERNLLGKEAAETVKAMIDEEIEEKVGEEIETTNKEIEEKLEEATAPENEKVVENETSPQQALEKNLEETAETSEQSVENEPEPGTEPKQAEQTSTTPSLDLTV